MNKYQKYILEKLNNGNTFVFSQCCSIDCECDKNATACGVFDETTDSFNITQDEDITKTQYVLIINLKNNKLNFFDGVFVHKNNQWEEIRCLNRQYRIVVDFNEKIDAIKFSFIDKIADDYTLKVVYTETDKDKYYAKLEQKRKDSLLKAATIKVSTGADLVNIYFQPCCDEYNRTEIRLFVPNEHVATREPSGPIQKQSSWSLIKKCNVPAEDFFKSITGLAYGKYAFILKQVDANNQLLLETDYMQFAIDKPQTPLYGRINII